MTNALRNILKAETDEAHQRLHEQRSFAALADGTIDLPAYIRLLQRLHDFYLPLDHAISVALEDRDAADFDYVRRSDLLALDLDCFGQNTARSIWRGARSVVTPTTVGGVLYVVEGAVLGGAQLDRMARKLLGDQSAAGRGYWAWCRTEGPRRWTLMLKYLDGLSGKGASVDDLIHGARATFAGLGDWLAPLDRPSATAEARTV